MCAKLVRVGKAPLQRAENWKKKENEGRKDRWKKILKWLYVNKENEESNKENEGSEACREANRNSSSQRSYDQQRRNIPPSPSRLSFLKSFLNAGWKALKAVYYPIFSIAFFSVGVSRCGGWLDTQKWNAYRFIRNHYFCGDLRDPLTKPSCPKEVWDRHRSSVLAKMHIDEGVIKKAFKEKAVSPKDRDVVYALLISFNYGFPYLPVGSFKNTLPENVGVSVEGQRLCSRRTNKIFEYLLREESVPFVSYGDEGKRWYYIPGGYFATDAEEITWELTYCSFRMGGIEKSNYAVNPDPAKLKELVFWVLDVAMPEAKKDLDSCPSYFSCVFKEVRNHLAFLLEKRLIIPKELLNAVVKGVRSEENLAWFERLSSLNQKVLLAYLYGAAPYRVREGKEDEFISYCRKHLRRGTTLPLGVRRAVGELVEKGLLEKNRLLPIDALNAVLVLRPDLARSYTLSSLRLVADKVVSNYPEEKKGVINISIEEISRMAAQK